MTVAAVHRYASREAWLAARRVGSSDVAALLGVSPYSRPWDVYERLVLGAPSAPRTAEQERGVLLEPRVLSAYAARTGRRVVRTPPHTLYTRDEWASATPDAIAGELLVEAKTDARRERWGPEQPIERWTEDAAAVVRPEYYLQVQHQLWVVGAAAADLAVLLPGDDPFLPELRVYRVTRDDELVRRMVDRLSAWWLRHVVQREPPPYDDSDAAGRALARIERAGVRAASATEAELAVEYERLARTQKEIEQRRKGIGRRLVELAGESARLELPGGGHATIVTSRSAAQLDEGALLADHPELASVLDRYRRQGSPYSYPRVVPGRER